MTYKPRKATKQQKKSGDILGRAKQSKEPTKRPSFWKILLENKSKLFRYQQVCVFIIAFAVFANGISNDYTIDDHYYTTDKNAVVNLGIKAIPQIFTTPTFHEKDYAYEYRPVAQVSFVLQHQLLNGSAHTSHFVNVFIYAVICWLLFILLCYWFGPARHWFALFVILLYAVHPLHTEIVDNIKSRDELLASLFCVVSMHLAWQWHIKRKWSHLILTAFFLLVALVSKSSVIAYVGIIPLAFYFFTDMSIRKIILHSATLIIPIVIYMLITALVPSGPERAYVFIENPLLVANVPLGIKTATATYVFGWYSYLHIIPYPLSFIYGYNYVQLLNWNNILPVLSLFPVLLLVYLIGKGFRKKSIVAFGATIYFGCIFLVSNLLKPMPGMMAERFTFFSSLGYCILLVSALYHLYKISFAGPLTNKNAKYLIATFSLIFVSYSAMSIVRNTQWENAWVLFNHDIKHLGNSVKANILMSEHVVLNNDYYRKKISEADNYEEKRLYQDSIRQSQDQEKLYLLRALEIYPDQDKALNNLAVIYTHQDSFEAAKKYLLRSRALMPKNPDVHYNLGYVYGMLYVRGHNPTFLDSGMNEIRKTIQLDSQYINGYWRLDQGYLLMKDTSSAISALLLGIKKIPDNPFLYIHLAQLYLQKRDTTEAIHFYEMGAAAPQSDTTLLSFLQNYYRSKNDTRKENYYRNKLNEWISKNQ